MLMCQQFGCGTFRKAKVAPVEGMHCYMNIPDSAERDSLFQAEARRCKDILDTISASSGPHLCLFDELYSGTNPVEAAGATSAYISYMSKHHPSTRFLLTTHLNAVCKDLDGQATMMKMGGKVDSTGFSPSYRCTPGISTLRSGFLVLKELDYPSEIIASLNTFVAEDN
jgi:DNA mismatch repair ATPase MutS